MRRAAALITVALALACAPPASAGVLMHSQALGVVAQMGQYIHRATGLGYQGDCWRATPWRFSCSLEVFSGDYTTDCTRYLDVVAQVYGRRVHVENLTPWTC